MTELTLHRESAALIKPDPHLRGGGAVSIRLATMDDFTFIDALQKRHSEMVGFLPRKVFFKRIADGNMLIAEDGGTRIGYCMFGDKYLKREELGIVYQLNIAPHKQRGLVGASLVKDAFERSAYGTRLFCCWCAQDIEANHFWESLGFVPLAFRAGSRGKAQGGHRKVGRLQIFWQRRTRENDTQTPYWYPTETNGGAMKENRLVLPIPPGTHWSDSKPMVLPGLMGGAAMEKTNDTKALERDEPKQRPQRAPKAPKPKANVVRSNSIRMGGLRFLPGATPPPEAKMIEPKPAKPKREKQKNDPKHVAAAREVRDRYLEEVNSGRMLPGSGSSGGGKYDVSRQLAAGGPPTGVIVIEQAPPPHLLNAA